MGSFEVDWQTFKKDKSANGLYVAACKKGDFNKVKYLLGSPELKEHADIRFNNYLGFVSACRSGHLNIVQYLLTSPDLKEHADIHAEDDCGFRSSP